ncbi:hypothetical protein A2619_03035 [candidate division WWE3 bacterium RIFOXYD1_FULL_39_9]|uniref:Uncharacterized protein n=1 Tax=candidate division WWE3 bacterium RIFOXYD1_FULL_39_9 TaxID=1802649 RepID=A0A1F4X927_UNCKA|nr:MAG: hypothetical protein A2619_03035 [candidate division WWE3 bacterium RIFOXYD1_FULL_39_9]
MNQGIITVIIFTIFLVAAIIVGNLFLSAVLRMPIDDVPTAAKVVVHGITLGLLFAVVKKFYSR